ncbi:MAG: hypothetical protein HOV68_12375, partial [Streptomycetaceae bacterium]|nr:hypothetical protein [Streptomycetaceae bacterium]
MTDEIHGSWFSERRNPLRRAQSSDAEGEAALRAALHLAVGEIRGLLGGASGQLREGEPFHSVLRRIGDHGVVVTLQDGRLDVPADQILAAPTAKDWASRSIMYYVVRELAVDEGLRSLFLAAEGDESEPSGPGDSGLGEVPDVLAA